MATTATKDKIQDEKPLPWAWMKAVNDVICEGPWLPENRRLPVQILPWLFLSDQQNLKRAKDLRNELGITHVLSTNSMSDVERNFFKDRLDRFDIQHHFVSGEDEEWYEMMDLHWKECLEVLKHVHDTENGRIVVHCHAGVNRSGLITIAALMHFERIALMDAVKIVKQKRGMLLTNRSFQRQLCQFAQNEGLLGPKPEGYDNKPPPPIGPPPTGPLPTATRTESSTNTNETTASKPRARD